ncbi:transposase [Bradyrhizobium sp. Tv2a-2]|uniref:transposase n=1 Tax=Bradyrhizobium sp. Tv2a-2 TaxID=113395 RepID=UPI0032DED326
MRNLYSDGRVVLRIRIGIGCGNDDDPEPAAILATRWQHRCSQCIALHVAQRRKSGLSRCTWASRPMSRSIASAAVSLASASRASAARAMRQRRETVEHPFGTMKARMGATHFLTKTLPKVAAEMALSVLAYNLTRVMNIVGIKPLIAAIAA